MNLVGKWMCLIEMWVLEWLGLITMSFNIVGSNYRSRCHNSYQRAYQKQIDKFFKSVDILTSGIRLVRKYDIDYNKKTIKGNL